MDWPVAPSTVSVGSLHPNTNTQTQTAQSPRDLAAAAIRSDFLFFTSSLRTSAHWALSTTKVQHYFITHHHPERNLDIARIGLCAVGSADSSILKQATIVDRDVHYFLKTGVQTVQ
jgi:hypothetical protein